MYQATVDHIDKHFIPEKSGFSVETDDIVSDLPSNQYPDEEMEWTEQEEKEIVKTLDKRLMVFILVMSFVLNMDRTNLSNAISDDLAADLGFTNDGVNLGILVYFIVFTISTFISSTIGKAVGTHLWIPILMTSWAIVTWAHALVHNFTGFMIVRVLIAATEGGFIPTCLTYMTKWYKTTEMATRLACFWAAQNFASATSGLIAFGVFRLEGTLGLEGWKWLFIVDGVLTHIIGFLAFFYLPSSPMQTEGKLRGKNGWFSERQKKIAMLRIYRDDETKRAGDRPINRRDIMQAATDTNLWVHLIITFLGQMHETPIFNYLPSIIKDSGFATTTANLLAAPAYIINLIFSIIIAHNSDKRGNVALHAIIGTTWALLGVCLLEFLPDNTDRWSLYGAALFTASAPSWHGMQIAWMSANLAPNGKRTIALAAVIAFANINGVPGSQIYQASDAPRFRKGNQILIGLLVATIVLFLVQRTRYVFVNKWRQARWNKLDDNEKQRYIEKYEHKGNNRLDFVYRL